MSFKSRGIVHHADSRHQCPDCGRTITTHTVVAEEPNGHITVGFKSKQTGQWGVMRLPEKLVTWGPSHKEAWAEQDRKDGRKPGGAKAR